MSQVDTRWPAQSTLDHASLHRLSPFWRQSRKQSQALGLRALRGDPTLGLTYIAVAVHGLVPLQYRGIAAKR